MTPLLRMTVCNRDNWRCQYCGFQWPESVRMWDLARSYKPRITLDHVIPRTKGGRDIADNLKTACSPCNQTRGMAGPLIDSFKNTIARLQRERDLAVNELQKLKEEIEKSKTKPAEFLIENAAKVRAARERRAKGTS